MSASYADRGGIRNEIKILISFGGSKRKRKSSNEKKVG
jgi:hypothetical protein